MKITKEQIKKIKAFEEKNLINYNGYVLKGRKGNNSILKNMQTRGWVAVRISPRPTIKFGLKYQKVFGAEVRPDYSGNNPRKGKFTPMVKWHFQGYAKAGKLSGTKLLQSGLGNTFNMKMLRSKLMIK